MSVILQKNNFKETAEWNKICSYLKIPSTAESVVLVISSSRYMEEDSTEKQKRKKYKWRTHKKCSACRKFKPFNCFYFSKKYSSWCKECFRIYRKHKKYLSLVLEHKRQIIFRRLIREEKEYEKQLEIIRQKRTERHKQERQAYLLKRKPQPR